MSDVVNDRAHHHYELTVDGHLAATHYAIEGGVFIHTEVPPELGGKGIGRDWSPVCILGFTSLNN
jgi:uncharacterized protein